MENVRVMKISAVTAACAITAAWFAFGWLAPEKASVLEARDPGRSFPQAGLTNSYSGKEWTGPAVEPVAAPPTAIDLNSAPTALVGFLEAHFDVNAKYRGGNDGTLCSDEIPCFDHTPPEVADAISKIYAWVLGRLGDRYDSETFWRIFFMSEDGSYDPARNPGVRLDDVDGSIGYIVEKYLAESGK